MRPLDLDDALEAARAAAKAPDRPPAPRAAAKNPAARGPDPADPGADRREQAPDPAERRPPERPQNARSRPEGPTGPGGAAAPAPAAEASQAAASGASGQAPRSAVARSRTAAAWAERDPEAADRLLRGNAGAVLELLAPDAAKAHGAELRQLLTLPKLSRSLEAGLEALAIAAEGAGFEAAAALRGILADLADPRERLVQLAAQLPSRIEAADGEPLSVLAAARERLGADRRDAGVIPPAPGRVAVVEAPEDRDRLPELAPEPIGEQLALPSMGPADRRLGPAPWLRIFDRLGGVSMARGRGSTLPVRLWVEALAWAPPEARFGALVNVPLTVRDLRDALWPNGWQAGRDLPKLRRAIAAVNGLGWLADAENRTEWAPILFRRRPGLAAKLSDPVLLQVQLPPVVGAGRGARFDRPTLRRLGLSSGPEYRAYLGLVHWWDLHLERGQFEVEGRPLPGLTPAERRRLIFGPDETAPTYEALRSRKRATDPTYEAMADRGELELEREGRIWLPRRRDLGGGR